MDHNHIQRLKLYGLLGDLPKTDQEVKAETVSVTKKENYILETMLLHLNTFEPVPAYLIKPKKAGKKNPAVLFNHSHGGNYALGKDEFIKGNVYLQRVPYAQELALMGCMGLCIDHWCFGARSANKEQDLFKEFLWYGKVLWGMMVFDSLRAVDYLLTRTDVDPARIGTMGMSMGANMAWWLSALDERIKLCIDICCMTDFEELINTRHLEGHGIYYYVPGLLKHFTTSQINALICPRPHLSLNGMHDLLTPLKGLEKINANMSKLYEELNVPGNWKMVLSESGHEETPLMRKEILGFLAANL